MNENELTHFHLERDGDKIKLQKGGDLEALQQALSTMAPAPMAAAAPATAVAATEPAAADPNALAAGEVEIPSPMVGTFYRAADPEAGSFADIGDEVGENSTVCIIEAMKVMNEIKAEIQGTVTKVLVENGTPVQYGEPLFRVKTS